MRFSDLPALTESTLASADVFPLTDASDTYDKKITAEDLAQWILTVYAGLNISWAECGAVTGVSPSAGSYVDATITFSTTCPSPTPRVFAMLRSTSTAQSRGYISAVVAAQDATGATLRVFNTGSSDLSSLVFNWFAVA